MLASVLFLAACGIPGQDRAAVTGEPAAEGPALTIYNQGFAVVRELVPLTLQPGVNTISRSGMTSRLEPDSVILRDPSGRRALRILEQNYRNDPVTQARLLEHFTGRTIEFSRMRQDGSTEIVRGRIVRSGFQPQALDVYGNSTYRPDRQPVIEVEGKMLFQLPGQPLFPTLGDDTILEPTLDWKIDCDSAGALDAELAYVTGGFSWNADYNVVAPEQGDLLDLVGWITMKNESGKTFENARIKLLAGDVNKLQPEGDARAGYAGRRVQALASSTPVVTERTFDEYHLYTLARATTLRDAQSKQVEFVRAAKVPSRRIYVYDGAALGDGRYAGWDAETVRNEPSYGTESNEKVWVMREFRNSAEQGLGLPLPRGRVRFYRQGSDGQLEFTGENRIDHTPKDEDLRIYTGNAFDLVGERVRKDYRVDTARDWLDETFEITLRNHKTEPAEFRVVEHLYRWVNWEILDASQEWTKKDSRTIEFRVIVPPDGEQKISYRAHYSW